MDGTEEPDEYATVVVRIRRDEAGRVSGLVERVGTGDKIRFRGLENLGAAVGSLLSTWPEASS